MEIICKSTNPASLQAVLSVSVAALSEMYVCNDDCSRNVMNVATAAILGAGLLFQGLKPKNPVCDKAGTALVLAGTVSAAYTYCPSTQMFLYMQMRCYAESYINGIEITMIAATVLLFSALLQEPQQCTDIKYSSSFYGAREVDLLYKTSLIALSCYDLFFFYLANVIRRNVDVVFSP